MQGSWNECCVARMAHAHRLQSSMAEMRQGMRVPEMPGLDLAFCERRLQSSMAEMRQGIRVPENGYSETSVAFMDKVMEISGLGDKTFLPDSAPPAPSLNVCLAGFGSHGPAQGGQLCGSIC